MKKEYWFMTAIGLVILSYVLDSVVTPLARQVTLTTPYHFFTLANLSKFPWTSTSILVKTVAIFILSLAALAILGLKRGSKAGLLLIMSGLMQLYALQDVASKAVRIPLEWSLALAASGIALLVPMVMFFLGSLIPQHKDSATPLTDTPPSTPLT